MKTKLSKTETDEPFEIKLIRSSKWNRTSNFQFENMASTAIRMTI